MRTLGAQRPSAAAGGSRDGRIKTSESVVFVRCRSEPSFTPSRGKGQPVNLARTVRLTRPRVITAIIAAVLAAAAALAFSSQAASARSDGPRPLHGNGGSKPVIVLEHGAWADASSWNRVIQRLQNDGYTVYAPPNPLRGLSGFLSSDPAYLHDFLTQNPALAGKHI